MAGRNRSKIPVQMTLKTPSTVAVLGVEPTVTQHCGVVTMAMSLRYIHIFEEIGRNEAWS